MVWQIRFTALADKELGKLDEQGKRQVIDFLEKQTLLKDPRSMGGAFTGSRLREFWLYSIGNQGIICDIRDSELLILILTIGDRRKISSKTVAER